MAENRVEQNLAVAEEQQASFKEDQLRALIRSVIEEFRQEEKNRSEPVYKAELLEERKRREQLERRLKELEEENRMARLRAEEASRVAAIREELQRLGVTKIDLAFKIVKDDIVKTDDGRLVARTETGEVDFREYLKQFVQENPEFLPARVRGGSGITAGSRDSFSTNRPLMLEDIRPGMSKEELERVREEIARLAGIAFRDRHL